MEITKRARLITDFYATAPNTGSEYLLTKWMNDTISKPVLSFAQQVAKKGQEAWDVLDEILSVFHRDTEGMPFLGNWMLRRCLVTTGLIIFNAAKDKSHPTKDQTPIAISLVEPLQIPLMRNGDRITHPDKVTTYTVTITKPQKRSFFKAYEVINAGAEFEFTVNWDEDFISESQMDLLLQKAGLVGTGGFRERFGKFEYI